MLDRVIDRVPALLLLGIVVLGAWVAVAEVDQPTRLVAEFPAVLLLLLYLRAGVRR